MNVIVITGAAFVGFLIGYVLAAVLAAAAHEDERRGMK